MFNDESFELTTDDFHRGCFYDIILSNPLIVSALNTVYIGLRSYKISNAQTDDLIFSLTRLMQGKTHFSKKWYRRSKIFCNLTNILNNMNSFSSLDIANITFKSNNSNIEDEKDELIRQKKREKNRRKKQKKKQQKQAINILTKEIETTDQYSRSTDVPTETIEQNTSQYQEESPSKTNEEDSMSSEYEDGIEMRQSMEVLLYKYSPVPKAQKIVPNISKKKLAKAESILAQLM